MPYILGAVLASYLYGKFNLMVFLIGLSAALLVQLSTHLTGEVYDIKEDRLSITLEKNFFSGGTGVLVENLIPQKKVKILTGVFIFLALFAGLILQFYFKTGKWTLALGISGIICGFFYSKPPLRWVQRGIGEILIGYAFGWLAVVSGFYIQVSRFDNLPFLISLPVAFSIVNVILINEYPDYPADLQTGKRNILVRIGKEKAAKLYAALVVLSGLSFFLGLFKGLPGRSALFYLPVLATAIVIAVFMVNGGYKDRIKLEKMCAATILVNLGTTLSCILGLLF